MNWYELICKAGSVANSIFIVTLLLVIAILCVLVIKDFSYKHCSNIYRN